MVLPIITEYFDNGVCIAGAQCVPTILYKDENGGNDAPYCGVIATSATERRGRRSLRGVCVMVAGGWYPLLLYTFHFQP